MNKKYPQELWTCGTELEYADVLFGQYLPEGASWNTKDNTVVNSNGIANDPKGEIYPYGGEINTKPTYSVSDQIDHIAEINKVLNPKPVINYRCNLHLHLRIPGVKNDLEALKRIQRYIDGNAEEAFSIVERVPKPDRSQMSQEAYDGAMKRYKRRFKSHQYMVPQSRLDEMYAAKTPHEFWQAHAPIGKDGLRMWYFAPRAGINLRQLFEETETIEFRHFPGTIDMVEMESCHLWIRAFMIEALSDNPRSPREIYMEGDYKFPEFAPYDYELEKMYQLTNFESNTRAQVKEIIAKLHAEGKI
jgi:hypothetical protein